LNQHPLWLFFVEKAQIITLFLDIMNQLEYQIRNYSNTLFYAKSNQACGRKIGEIQVL